MSEHREEKATTLRDVAQETPEESTEQEREAVGDHPDTGDLVPEDDAQ